jgi:V8-like Glu-specific endopeptidase
MRTIAAVLRGILLGTLVYAQAQEVYAQSSSSPESQSQQSSQESQSQQEPTKTQADHAASDVIDFQKLLKKQPKKVREAAAGQLGFALAETPSTSTELKQAVEDDKDHLLYVDPKRLNGKDLATFGPVIQQVLDPGLLPIAALPDGLQLIDLQGINNPLVRAVMARSAALSKVAQSVGRIEVAQGGGPPQLVGTAFVIAPGYLMTACHVAKDIAQVDPATNTWQLKTDTYVDFSTSVQHAASQEFVVKGISKISAIRGFDVAILQVEGKSRDSAANLPAKLDLALQEVNKQIPIAVIGFPALDDIVGTPTTIKSIERLKAATPQVAKYVSPGQVLSNEPRMSFHVLVHIGSTHAGNSGSPVFSLDPVQVVGIHYCCTGVDGDGLAARLADSGDCSSTAAANIHSNEAISAADARALIPTVTTSTSAGIQYQAEPSGFRTVAVVRPRR